MWLPLAQYTKNSWPSATTKKTPFDLLIGFTPRVHQPTRRTQIPTLEQRLTSIKEAKEAAQEAQRQVQASWIKEKPRFKPYDIGSKVWLEGTNLRLPSNTMPKLSPRRYGPFEVVSIISPIVYKLRLPPSWKIHDVFHTSLLTPYKETEQHGPNFLEPPPDIVEGEPEWEVEQILDKRLFGRHKKKQYLVHWKDYSPAHDQWVNKEDLHTPELIQEFRQRMSIKATYVLDQETCPTSNSPTPQPHTSKPQMTAPSSPMHIKEETPSPIIPPSGNEEDQPPTLSLTPLLETGRSSSGVRSPLRDDQDNLTTSSASPLPTPFRAPAFIPPPRPLAPVLLTVPPRPSPTSSQDEVLLGNLDILRPPQAVLEANATSTAPPSTNNSPTPSLTHQALLGYLSGAPDDETREHIHKFC